MSKLKNIEAKKIVALSFIILFCVINLSWVPLPLRISVYILTTSLSVLSSGAVFSFYNNIPDTQHSLLTTGQYKRGISANDNGPTCCRVRVCSTPHHKRWKWSLLLLCLVLKTISEIGGNVLALNWRTPLPAQLRL